MAEAYIEDPHVHLIKSDNSLKVLAFHFSKKPNIQLQVDMIMTKMNSKLATLAPA